MNRSSWCVRSLGGLGLAAIAVTAGCAGDDLEISTNTLGTFEEFVATVYREPGTGLYIVDGDTPVQDIEELRSFYDHLTSDNALAVYRVNGNDVVWNSAQKLNLTYCVSTGFGANYGAVVNAMNAAAADWEGSAYVDFHHLSGQDGACNASNNAVLFDVSPTSGQPYLARAFFPNYGRATRNVLIDSSSFGPLGVWTLTGILRHELGHTLGFRHEHTRPEAGVCFEDNNWRGVTPYDAQSVMHYPQCNGTQTGDLVLTGNDRAGAAALYGGFFGGSTWFRAAGWCNHSGSQLLVGDSNGDNRSDLLCHDGAGNKWIDYADGAGQFWGTDFFRAAGWCNHSGSQLFVADFNADNRDDLLCHDSAGNKWIDYADGAGQYWGTDWSVGSGWCSHGGSQLFVDDFNGDSRDDILCHDGAGQKWVDFADGAGTFGGTDYYRNAGWCTHAGSRLLTGAFNIDGRSDLMCHDTAGNKWIAYSGL
jgi:hypothetical protein